MSLPEKALDTSRKTVPIFPTLTVQQNLELGLKNMKQTGRWSLEDVYRNFPRLQERCNVLGVHLSGGEQQMLTICRSLMGDPDLHHDRTSRRKVWPLRWSSLWAN